MLLDRGVNPDVLNRHKQVRVFVWGLSFGVKLTSFF